MEVSSPEHIESQVAALLQRNRTGQARALLKPALASHPEHAGLLLQSAYVDYLEDRYDDSLATVKQVLTIDPSESSARQLYFELLVEKNQLAEAEQVIIGLLREFPESADRYGRYSRLMLRALKLVKARQLADEGLKYDPDDAECLAARAICDVIEQRQGDVSHGLQQLLVRHPQSLQTLLLIVVALQERGDTRGAYRVAQELVRAQPDNRSLVNLAHQLKAASHWSMLPLWPMQRWGWGASFAIWILAIVAARTIDKVAPQYAAIFVGVLLTYVAYSWVWPPLLRRLMK